MAAREGLGRVHATDYIKSQMHQAVKQYITYDASNRMEYSYAAMSDAVDGEPCIVTQYVYDGTSTRIIKMKESIGTWVSATMDI